MSDKTTEQQIAELQSQIEQLCQATVSQEGGGVNFNVVGSLNVKGDITGGDKVTAETINQVLRNQYNIAGNHITNHDC